MFIAVLFTIAKLWKQPRCPTNNEWIKKMWDRRIPRWQLEGGSRKHASYSEILEKRWRHTLQARPPRRGKTLTPPHLQPAQRISTSR
jgi:hypothetical protein